MVAQKLKAQMTIKAAETPHKQMPVEANNINCHTTTSVVRKKQRNKMTMMKIIVSLFEWHMKTTFIEWSVLRKMFLQLVYIINWKE